MLDAYHEDRSFISNPQRNLFRTPCIRRSPQSAEPGRMRIVPWKQRLFTGAAGTQEVPVAGTMMS